MTLYSDLEDSSQVFELRNQIRNLKQGDGHGHQYCTALKKLWLEMDLFTVYEWKDPDDGVLYHICWLRTGVFFSPDSIEH